MTRPRRGWSALLAIGMTTALMWLWVLPKLADWDPIRRDIDFLENRGIDPAALFYTDLEVMAEVDRELEARRLANPEAFWSWNQAAPKPVIAPGPSSSQKR